MNLKWSKEVELKNWESATISAPLGWRLPTIQELKDSKETFKPKMYLSCESLDKSFVSSFNFYNMKESSVCKQSTAYYVRYVKEV